MGLAGAVGAYQDVDTWRKVKPQFGECCKVLKFYSRQSHISLRLRVLKVTALRSAAAAYKARAEERIKCGMAVSSGLYRGLSNLSPDTPPAVVRARPAHQWRIPSPPCRVGCPPTIPAGRTAGAESVPAAVLGSAGRPNPGDGATGVTVDGSELRWTAGARTADVPGTGKSLGVAEALLFRLRRSPRHSAAGRPPATSPGIYVLSGAGCESANLCDRWAS